MARKGKLIDALERHQGRNIRLEKQRQQEKAAAKKRAAAQVQPAELEALPEDDGEEWEDEDSEGEEDNSAGSGADGEGARPHETRAAGISLKDQLAGLMGAVDAENAADSDPEADDFASDDDEDEDSEGGIPLSDIASLASDDQADVVPYQRLTINNKAALNKAYRAIAFPASEPFAATQSVTSAEPTVVADVEDDLGRELAFYKQCLDAATEARALLRQASVPFTRPADFFAEMVKTDEHMGKIRAKMTEKESNKKAAAEARKLRDLKKFGKQVQVAKLQERDKAKRDTLDKINQLKRKRNASSGDTREEDLFDVALEEADSRPARNRAAAAGRGKRDQHQPNPKRQRKNDKYGLGGKKKYKKSGDATSSADLSGFNPRRMKAGGKGSGAKRLGKSRRAKMP